MGRPLRFPGANSELTAPPGNNHNVSTMPVYRNGTTCTSCWQLSPDELREVIDSGGKVFLSVMFGNSQPPVYVGSESSVRELCADYGVWKR